ncbi:TonB-dependent receptor [Telluribacter sp. SYSU D00476]|uniref:SusC/RagA family TonB-linked outer membrane protein n=1 Tax=Telluribacter sp. SYSU D00476 TaxID=2811430 RepID=UPI001FF6D363|nr:TonB-dependent receptor [Telluribacter sp. SYSU D00476]
MKRKILLFHLLFLILSIAGANAQQITVSGRVTTQEDGSPLPGANVLVKGTTIGTATDADGNYTIQVPNANSVLVFQMLGMGSQEVPVGNQTSVNVALAEDTRSLNEVVVVGYGTQRKLDVTGAVSQVKGEDLVRQPVLTATQAIQSKLAGVQVINSGEPGQTPSVRIRGTGTLLGGENPLYVVDGIITEDIRNINTNDIASIDVLKDPSSTAIYGVRAANGVVLITTKKGRTGQMSVNYDGYVGIRTLTNRVRMADARLFAQYSNEAAQYDNQPLPYDLNTIPTSSTDWLSAITRTGFQQNHNVSITGGTEKTTYLFSAGYMEEEGVLKGSRYDRISLRLNNEYTIFKDFKLGHNLSLASEDKDNRPASAFTNAYRQSPLVSVRDVNGAYGYSTRNNVANPVAQLDYTNDNVRGMRFQGGFYGNLNLFNHLSLYSNFGIETGQNRGTVYNPVYEVSSNQRNPISSLALNRNNFTRWVWTNTATYENSYADKHNVKFLVGYTTEQFTNEGIGGTRQGVPAASNYWTLNTGDASSATNFSTMGRETRLSYLSRLNYNYDDRYLLTATVRYDGSSKFPMANRWGIFPSLGLGWVISEEEFFKNQSLFNVLKLRASWGKTGNDAIPAGAFQYTITPGLDYPLGPDQSLSLGNTLRDIKDLNLRWEITQGTDFGVEFGMFNNRLTGEIDYYNKLTTGALIFRPLDAIFGSDSYLTNAADVRNTGWEFALNWRNTTDNDLSYNFGFNLTANRNRIENVSGGLPIIGGGIGNGQFTTQTEVGQPIGSFWVWQTDGIFQSQEEIDRTTAVIANTKPGDFRYRDVNNDGRIDQNDRVYVGSYQPRLYFGINTSINYRSWDLSADFYANFGNKIYNGKKAQRFGNENIEASRADRWTPTNPSNTEPRASNEVPISSTYYIESGDFFRINNVTLGYTLPEGVASTIRANRLRVYASAQNPLTLQKYSGFSPELPGGPLGSGIELNAYPVNSIYTLGINVGF